MGEEILQRIMLLLQQALRTNTYKDYTDLLRYATNLEKEIERRLQRTAKGGNTTIGESTVTPTMSTGPITGTNVIIQFGSGPMTAFHEAADRPGARQPESEGEDRLPAHTDAKRVPVDIEQVIRNASDYAKEPRTDPFKDLIIGNSPVMRKMYSEIAKILPTDVPVLIQGESGVGKEGVARALHDLGPRRGRRFEAINCAVATETLMESELFGEEKGSHSVAEKVKAGLFERNNRGTVFLDEIGSMKAGMQPMLLRVLEQSEVKRVGGGDLIRVDVRIVSADKRDLEQLAKEGVFRDDLRQRLTDWTVTIPPLRDRMEDIPLLATFFLTKKFPEKLEKPAKCLSEKSLRLLLHYNWLGNVRELERTLKAAYLTSQDVEITPDDLVAARKELARFLPQVEALNDAGERKSAAPNPQVSGNEDRTSTTQMGWLRSHEKEVTLAQQLFPGNKRKQAQYLRDHHNASISEKIYYYFLSNRMPGNS